MDCYPKTNTNMFVIACGFNNPGVENSRIRKFISPRRKDAKFGICCHFDPWEKSILDPSCFLGMTGIARHLCELSASYENAD